MTDEKKPPTEPKPQVNIPPTTPQFPVSTPKPQAEEPPSPPPPPTPPAPRPPDPPSTQQDPVDHDLKPAVAVTAATTAPGDPRFPDEEKVVLIDSTGSRVSTIQPFFAAVPETKNDVDFTDVIEGVQIFTKGDKKQALVWLFNNRGLLGKIKDALVGLVKHKKDQDKVKETAPVDETEEPTKPATKVKPNEAPPVVSLEDYEVDSLKVEWMAIETPKGSKPNTGQRLYNKSEFDKAVAGSDPVRHGSRLHINITPVDRHGRPFQPGEERNKLLLQNPNSPNAGPLDAGNFLLQTLVDSPSDIGITSDYDDYGCTPTLKVERWSEGQFNDQSWVTAQVRYVRPRDGKVIVSGWLPKIRIAHWNLDK